MENKSLRYTLPPMGWNSFCSMNCEPNQKVLMEAADALVETGLKDAGYIYVNLDDGWIEKERGSDGRLVVRKDRFPDGMRALTDYIHKRGLKAGIYLGCGQTTWNGDAGSVGHEFEDAQDIADWGFDFLKYDDHPTEMDPPDRDLIAEYIKMACALKATGRDILYNICDHGSYSPWKWAQGVSPMWRIGIDIRDQWDGPTGEAAWSLMDTIDCRNADLYPYAGVGHFNDPDMLVVGMHKANDWMGPGCTDTEYMTNFALWCMMAAPLMIGCDIRNMTETTKKILMHKGLIAIDQDPLCVQARRVRHNKKTGEDVWVKPLSDMRWAVALTNRSKKKKILSFKIEDLNLSKGVKGKLWDVWEDKDAGKFDCEFSVEVESHGTKVYIFSPVFGK